MWNTRRQSLFLVLHSHGHKGELLHTTAPSAVTDDLPPTCPLATLRTIAAHGDQVPRLVSQEEFGKTVQVRCGKTAGMWTQSGGLF